MYQEFNLASSSRSIRDSSALSVLKLPLVFIDPEELPSLIGLSRLNQGGVSLAIGSEEKLAQHRQLLTF